LLEEGVVVRGRVDIVEDFIERELDGGAGDGKGVTGGVGGVEAFAVAEPRGEGGGGKEECRGAETLVEDGVKPERRGFWPGRRGQVVRVRAGCGASALGELGRGPEIRLLDG
jgi:hypothetical protein